MEKFLHNPITVENHGPPGNLPISGEDCNYRMKANNVPIASALGPIEEVLISSSTLRAGVHISPVYQ
jgi:hypothetical protein